MLKLKRLDARGVAHHFLLAVVVVGVAVGGTYYLVTSHADSCSAVSDPVTAATSDPTCQPGSGPTSGPTSAPSTSPLACNITNVPSTVTYGQKITPSLTFINGSDQVVTPKITGVLTVNGKKVGSQTKTLPQIAPASSYTFTSDIYTAPKVNKPTTATISVSGLTPYRFNCSVSFLITS